MSNICGVLVYAVPDRMAGVLEALAAMPGVEVHAAEGGRIVTTLEDTAEATALDTLTAMHKLDGIVAASLVYHHFGAAEDAVSAA